MKQGPGRPTKKQPLGSASLKHYCRIQDPIDGYDSDGTPIAHDDDAIDSANWTASGRIFAKFKAMAGPVYVNEETYYTHIATVRRIDATGITAGNRLIREDDKIYVVALEPVEDEEDPNWNQLFIKYVT